MLPIQCLTVLLALFAQAALGEEHLYHIVPVGSTSLCQQYRNGTCFTLDTFPSIMDNKEKGNITLSFYPGEHLLTQIMNFSYMTSITLINEQKSTIYPRIRCIGNTHGLYISNTDIFVMQGLVIHGSDSDSEEPMIQVKDVSLYRMLDCKLINNYRKPSMLKKCYGGIIYILRAVAVIKNTDFKNNKFTVTSIYMYDNCDVQATSALIAYNSSITIDSCLFEKNIAKSPFNSVEGPHGSAVFLINCKTEYVKNSLVINTTFVGNQATGNGAAIAMYVSMIDIKNSVFKSNQANYYAGAVYIGHYSKVDIFNSTFHSNQVDYGGGAISIAYESIVNINNSKFDNNQAEIGGAIVIKELCTVNINNSPFYNNQATDKGGAIAVEEHSTVNIIYSIFDSNLASFGGAMYVDTSTATFDQLSTRTEITKNKATSNGAGIYINSYSKLNVYSNMLIANNFAHVSGGGIYATGQNEISFQFSDVLINKNCIRNSINILNNKALKDGGGMYLSSTCVTIQDSNITVSDNHADRFGGGLYFVDNSKVIVTKCDEYKSLNYYLHLKSNSAQKGGGVYVSDEPSFITNLTSCFLSNINLPINTCFDKNMMYCNYRMTIPTHFENNIAVVTGSDIYGGMLDMCEVSVVKNVQHQTSMMAVYGIMYMRKYVKWTWGNKHNDTIENDQDFFNHISSDPKKVCFCVDNIVNCTFTHPTVHKKKGETFTLSLVVTDQLGKPVNAPLRSSLNSISEGKGRLKAGQQFRTIPDQCTDVEYNVYYNQNKTVLELFHDGPYGYLPLSKKEVNIVFDPCTCPIGFDQQYNPIDCSCDCTEALKPHIKHCWKEEGTFELKDNNWIQYINNTGFTVHNCPFDFCVREPVNISFSKSSDIQCAFNRIGIMCGKCDQGLSMVFATSQCQQCSDFYLFLLIPFGLAGIALVAFILLLNMTVATGTIHGLIFYANILAANRSVFIPSGSANVLTVFVSWLNLDLGIETCFYNGMDSYGKLMLQLVFPAYVFFLIIIIIVLCDHSQRIARLFGKRNPEATLYTLFLLSYSKLIRTIITALQFTTLNYPDGTKEIVWLYDANVRYFALNHIPRFLAAFIITILEVMYTSLLLFGQLFIKYSEHRMMKWTSHKYYIHFMKAHHAPLFDNHRYWVGLLLLARLTHYIISAFTNKFIIVLSVLITTSLLLVHEVVFRPYAKRFLILLDTFFVLNLLVLAGSTFYVKLSGGNQQALAFVSLSISFIAFVVIVFYHILDSCGVKLKNVLTKILPTHNRNKDNIYYTLVAIPKSEDENTEDESDEELIDLSNAPEDSATNKPYDPTRYITPPVIRSAVPDDQLREPALDDLCPLTPADYNFHPATPPTKQR